jgi:hypothetical protein
VLPTSIPATSGWMIGNADGAGDFVFFLLLGLSGLGMFTS